ncbi:MAG: iron-sulfur cluster assembly protein [Acidobacteriota bacterium]
MNKPEPTMAGPGSMDPAGGAGDPDRSPHPDGDPARASNATGESTTPSRAGAPASADASGPPVEDSGPGGGAAGAEGPRSDSEPPGAKVVGDPELGQRIVAALRTCYDPEIPVDIWELGLVYSIHIDPERNVAVQMTLTSPMCPVAGSLPPEVEYKVAAVHGVRDARVDLVWEPMWNKDMMSAAAQVKLNLF